MKTTASFFLAFALASISSISVASSDTFRIKPTIFDGIPDTDPMNDNVVGVRIGYNPQTGGFGLCSGSLVTPRIVLTAYHCVAPAITKGISCNSDDGGSRNGSHVGPTYDPSTIEIVIGSIPAWEKPVVRAKSLVVPKTNGVLCNSDIALVVLEKPIVGIVPLRVRMHPIVSIDETISSIGYGRTNVLGQESSGSRFIHRGVKILKVSQREFEVGRSFCNGDSGGPAISEKTGAVVGIVSRGGNCANDAGHIYTMSGGFDDLIEDAQKQAGERIASEEGGPLPAAPLQEGDFIGCNCSVVNSSKNDCRALSILAIFLFLFRRRTRK